MVKKLALVALAAFLLVSMAGCKMPRNQVKVVEGSEPVLTDEVERIITEYIEQEVAHPTRGGPSFAAHEIYGTEQKDGGRIHVYLWTYFMEYYWHNGRLNESSGASLPLVIILEKDARGELFVTGHHQPMDGAEYEASVRSLFPEKYHDRIFSRNHVRDLEPLVRQKAERYSKPTPYETVNNFDGVVMVVKSGTASSAGLTVVLENRSNSECIFGEFFALEEKINGRWHQVPIVIENYGFNDIGYALAPGEQREWTADWVWLYGDLGPGEYRIVKDILDFKSTGNYKTHFLAAEFSL